MSIKGLEVIDHSVQLTHEWINELAEKLGWQDQKQVLHLLRAVLTGVRDHLPHEESAGFAAQLPILIRGMYYEGWRPAATPNTDRSKEGFVGKIEKTFSEDREYSGEKDITLVMRFLSGKVTAGEISDVRNAHELAFVMGHDSADHRVLEFSLVQVDDNVQLFLADELGHGIAGLFGQGAVGPPRPGAVEVPDIHIGQFLPAGIVDVNLRIRPLVQRI